LGSVRCAIVGYGAIADFHVVALRAHGAELRAVVGPNVAAARVFAGRHGIPRAIGPLEDVLAMPDVDAIVVASPSALHATQTRAALLSGKHVLCEIPVALSLPEAEAVERAGRDSGLIAMVCHTQRYWPALAMLRLIIDRDRLTLRHVVARSMMHRHENVGWTGRHRTWTDNLLWHHGCHAVDTVLQLLSDPIESVVASSGPRFETSKLPMDHGIVIRTRSNALATIALSYNSRRGLTDYVVIADGATYLIRDGSLESGDGSVLVGGDADETLRSAVADQDMDFLSAVSHGSTPRSSIDSVLPTMRVLQQVEDLRPADVHGAM
jgi:2-hydroxy-4-carboxymuconate semialdehyde hemiacetal dehydrogenase